MGAIAKNRRLTFIFLSDFDAVFSLNSLLNYLSVVCQIGPVVLEERIKMQKANDRQMTDAQW
jgi:hypothetical protein